MKCIKQVKPTTNRENLAKLRQFSEKISYSFFSEKDDELEKEIELSFFEKLAFCCFYPCSLNILVNKYLNLIVFGALLKIPIS